METPTQTLHRLTSYELGRDWDETVDDPRIVQDFEPNDLDRLPWFYKRYAETLPVLELPRDLAETPASAIAVLAGATDVPERELDLPYLSRLLHLSAGVVRTSPRPYGTYLFRAAGSAGGRFPLELYVAVPDGTALPPGVHWYHPEDHALVRVGPPPRGDAPAVVVTGIPWRTGWRYRERGYRHVFWDAGTMLAQLLAGAESGGVRPALYSTFPDARVATLVGADRVHELPVAVVALGGEPALEPGGPAALGEVDAAPIEFPLVTPAYRAGERDALGVPWSVGEPVDVPDEGPSVDRVILARGSQRLMDASRSLPRELLETSLRVALRGVDLPHFVAVHAVDGLAPGIYRWPDLDAPVRAGDLREELYRVCLDQGLGRDAAFVVISAADVPSLDDRAY
ncbi:MAG: hypothetical protein M3134_03420, partial [Actinomycetota bacterium]|nr:hypothetical protein [Actinomycetota bacterium]